MLLVGLECGIEERCLDKMMVCFGAGFRLPQSNIGEEPSVAAANVVTLGSSSGSILHSLEPCGVAHLLIAPSLFEVGDHALELSISSQKVQHLLLPIQVVRVVGVQVNIKVSHEHRGTSSGGVLIKSSLNMSVEVIQALLPRQKTGSNDRDFANASATQATDAVVAMTMDVLQVPRDLLPFRPSWGIDRDRNASLGDRVGFSGIDVIPFKVFGVNNRVAI